MAQQRAFRVRLVPGKADDALENAAKLSTHRLRTAIKLIVEIGKSNIVAETPIGHSGALAAGYQTDVRTFINRVQGTINNPVIYHDIRDEGRRAGRRPPTAALMPWVGSKLGIPPGPQREAVAFQVARKIGRVGYPGSGHVERGWRRTRTETRPVLRKLGLQIVKDIDA